MQLHLRRSSGNFIQHLFEGMLGAMTQSVIQMNAPLGLMVDAPTQHAHHRGDANAPCDQHHGQVGLCIDVKVARGRTKLQYGANLHVVVEMVGRQACG